MNQIHFIAPYTKQVMAVKGETPYTNEVIEDFVKKHKRTTLRRLRPINMYDIWVSGLFGKCFE